MMDQAIADRIQEAVRLGAAAGVEQGATAFYNAYALDTLAGVGAAIAGGHVLGWLVIHLLKSFGIGDDGPAPPKPEEAT